MKERKQLKTGSKKSLDRVFARSRKGPGRPGVPPSEIRGRAEDYRLKLRIIWDNIRDRLLKAQTESEVISAFSNCAEYNSRPFVPQCAGLILRIIHKKPFRKRSKPQMNFLADSLAGGNLISPRRSRDICAEERAKDVAPSEHRIIRREFYVECTCGYKGPARDNACENCGAIIPDWLEIGKGVLYK